MKTFFYTIISYGWDKQAIQVYRSKKNTPIYIGSLTVNPRKDYRDSDEIALDVLRHNKVIPQNMLTKSGKTNYQLIYVS